MLVLVLVLVPVPVPVGCSGYSIVRVARRQLVGRRRGRARSRALADSRSGESPRLRAEPEERLRWCARRPLPWRL